MERFMRIVFLLSLICLCIGLFLKGNYFMGAILAGVLTFVVLRHFKIKKQLNQCKSEDKKRALRKEMEEASEEKSEFFWGCLGNLLLFALFLFGVALFVIFIKWVWTNF